MTLPNKPADQAQPEFPLYDPTAHADADIDNPPPELATALTPPAPVPPAQRGVSRRRMLWLGAAGIAAVGVVMAGNNAFGPRRGGTFTIPASAKVLVITTESGDVQLRAAAGTPVGEWSDMLAPGAQTPTVIMDGDTARISGDGRTDLTIGVAQGVEVRVETRSGDVTGSDLTAAGVTVQTASGDVQLRLSSAGGQVTVSTASGDVQVRLSGAPEGVTVNTASGDVSVTLPQPTGGDGYLVTTQTASGDVDAIASDGRRPVTVTTASGDISVQY